MPRRRSGLPKYVKVVHMDGRRYYYLLRRGKRTRLPALPYSPEFMEAYYAALAGAPSPPSEIGADRTGPGSINDLIVRFYKSYQFTKNRAISQATDRNILEAFRAKHGQKRVKTMERRHVLAAIAEKEGKPAAQRNLLRVLRVLLGFAVDEGMRSDNPALGIRLKKGNTRGFHSWTEDELHHVVGWNGGVAARGAGAAARDATCRCAHRRPGQRSGYAELCKRVP